LKRERHQSYPCLYEPEDEIECLKCCDEFDTGDLNEGDGGAADDNSTLIAERENLIGVSVGPGGITASGIGLRSEANYDDVLQEITAVQQKRE
jgi:hypothetical protein